MTHQQNVPGNALSASIVMPTYNKARYLDLTLASYLEQTGKNFEIIVSDDGSHDDTRKVVEKYRPDLNIKYLHQANSGRSSARNAALRVAEGEIIIFSDDDRIASPQFVAMHVREFTDASDPKHVFGWQHAILTWWLKGLTRTPAFEQFLRDRPELRRKIANRNELCLVSADDVRRNLATVMRDLSLDEAWWMSCLRVIDLLPMPLSEFRLSWCLGTTGNLSVGRKKLAEIGFFDETFSGWGVEDNDICYRLCKSNSFPTLSREAVNFHQVHPRSPRFVTEAVRNFKLFEAKHQTIDVYLFAQLMMKQRDPASLHAVSRECEALTREGRSVLVDEMRHMYGALENIEQQTWLPG